MTGRTTDRTADQRVERSRTWRAVASAVGTAVALAGAALVSAAAPANAVVWTSPCTATVHVDSSWGGTESWAGAVLTVTIKNPATTASTTWTATSRLADGQSVGAVWNGRSVGTGPSLVVHDDGNGSLAPGASTTFGVYLTGGSQIPSLTCVSDAPRPVGNTVVTLSDSSRTVNLVQGDLLTVRLPAGWSRPVAGAGLELVSVTGGSPSSEPLEAVYRASYGSSITVTSQNTDIVWIVTVRVAVPPPTVP
jgi:Cellulose binding domain